MDDDGFSRATRLGRAAAEAVVRAASGDALFDGFSTCAVDRSLVELSGDIATASAYAYCKEVDRDLFTAAR